MGHLYHGYVSHNQRVTKYPIKKGMKYDDQPLTKWDARPRDP